MLQFDWDDANRNHIARHGVGPQEAEEAFNSDTLELDAYERRNEPRLAELGITDSGRILFVVTTMRGKLVRVVTAYDATRTQRLKYLAYYRSFYE